ncbi:protein FAR1-RELATED SEQUENCE 5-like [Gastrolobium bilobum]|uniref:protein FAR1-RELATED SEQUENCE 5-like n=1 Tax=Gastrolobium bilobum TaxID=150636 RepID=UPI002AB2564F|nr:protein FAR1-RELATED SEQUENCE 5-like [Gastrolobium bilobum]
MTISRYFKCFNLVSTIKELLQKLRETSWDAFLVHVREFYIKHDVDIPDISAKYIGIRGHARNEQELSWDYGSKQLLLFARKTKGLVVGMKVQSLMSTHRLVWNSVSGDLGSMDEDVINYANFNENEDDMLDKLGDDILNEPINNMSNSIVLTPTKNIDCLIEVGMEFSERKDILDLYTTFARTTGFGVRVRTTKKNYIKVTCAREGFAEQKKKSVDQVSHGNLIRRTSSARIGCEACIKACTNEKIKLWRITYFSDNHNHGLVSPMSVSYLRSHKKMPAAAKSLIEKFNDSGLPIGKVATILRGNDVLFDSRDCYNHMKNVRKKIYDAGDAQAVLHYCVKQKTMNPNFFYSIKCDEDDRMESFFWIDARCRQAYELFGDVITFDTTYRTNKYSMPFGPFVGDMAITNAVSKVFPKAKHRFCLWHIMKKFPEKLSRVYHEHASFGNQIHQSVWNSKSTEDFDDRWNHILVKYGLDGNEWLHTLYSIRSSWVPIFNRSTFFAGMNTTQRSESINSFFDGFVTAGTTLKEFVEKYNQAVDTRYESFRMENFESMHKERRLFSKELCDSLQYSTEKLGNDGEWVTYRVFNMEDIENSATVEIKVDDKEARCSCQYFEFMGILRKHILAILFVEGVYQIPEHFILRRWSKEGNYILSSYNDTCFSPGDGLLQNLQLSSKLSRLAELAKRSHKAFRIINDGVDSLAAFAEKCLISEESEGLEDFNLHSLDSLLEESSIMNLKDPNISQTKGCKRIQSGIEEASKHTNIRGHCKKRGHNKRTCKEKNGTDVEVNFEASICLSFLSW